jgi:hypothetical protein
MACASARASNLSDLLESVHSAVGELAAKIAVDNIPHIFSKYAKEGNAVSALRRAFVEANSIINTRGAAALCSSRVVEPDGFARGC